MVDLQMFGSAKPCRSVGSGASLRPGNWLYCLLSCTGLCRLCGSCVILCVHGQARLVHSKLKGSSRLYRVLLRTRLCSPCHLSALLRKFQPEQEITCQQACVISMATSITVRLSTLAAAPSASCRQTTVKLSLAAAMPPGPGNCHQPGQAFWSERSSQISVNAGTCPVASPAWPGRPVRICWSAR